MLTEMHISAVRNVCRNKNEVIEQVIELFKSAYIPYGPVRFEQYDQFQAILPQNLRLLIIDSQSHGQLLYKGDRSKEFQNMILLLHNEHYYSLRSLPSWFSTRHYCIECEARYNDKTVEYV